MPRKTKKLLLINPVNPRKRGLMVEKHSIYPPMALGIIASLTPDDWVVEILDENFEEFSFRAADLVGFTSLTATVNRCYELAGNYRDAGIPTVIGGIHASMMPGEAARFVDAVVIGEAESIWQEVLADAGRGKLRKYYHGNFTARLQVPAPNIGLYHPGYEFGSVQTTRGCPMTCEFCSVHTFNGSKYRLRSVEDSVRDFVMNDKERIYIVDDNFVGYSKKARDHALAFFKGVADAQTGKQWIGSASMNVAEDEEILDEAARSGCKVIFLGIESELIDQLERSRKMVNLKIGTDRYAQVYDSIHKRGIAVTGAFIFGLDKDTPETISHRTDYILGADVDIIQATILTPLPGTELFNRFKEEGRLLYTDFPGDWERYNYTEVVFRPEKMTADEFRDAVHANWERLYDLKTIRKKFLRTIKLTRDPVTAIWALSSNVHLRNFSFEGLKEPVDYRTMFPDLKSFTG